MVLIGRFIPLQTDWRIIRSRKLLRINQVTSGYADIIAGLDRFNGSSWQSFLQGDSILDIAQDKNGTIWVATDHGVFRYDGSSFQIFTTADGLLDNSVNSIVIDNNNNVWCGTGYGINYFNGKSWQSMTTTEGSGG